MATKSCSHGHRSLATRGMHQSSPSFGSSTKESPRRAYQEHLWQDLFQNPSAWWDNRHHKPTRNQPDFRHKDSREPLWLNSLYKPSWVDARLASLHPQGPFLSRGHEIIRLCEEANLDMAFETLSALDQQGVVPSEPIYFALLKGCNKKKSLTHVLQLQAHLLHHGLDVTSFIGDYLVVTLARCGAIEDSCEAFRRLPHRTVFSLTAIISAYSDCGKGREALNIYREMSAKGFSPDKVTISSMLKACCNMLDLDEGRTIHLEAEKMGFSSDLHVGSSLLSLYGRCGCIFETQSVFSKLYDRDVVSWNIMLSAYVKHGEGEKALLLYRQMQAEYAKPDQRTFVISLQACCSLAKKEAAFGTGSRSVVADIGDAFHADLSKQDLASDIYINNTLVSLYAKCACIREAQNVFCQMSKHNIESWNEMLTAYLEQGECEKALQLYGLMHSENVCSDQWTLVLALQACWTLAARESCLLVAEMRTRQLPWLEIGEALHADAEIQNLTSHVFVGNSLVNMYGKCRKVREAEKVFERLKLRDTVSWNAMLSAYVDQVGYGSKALELYMQMEASGQAPDDITLSCLLGACCGRGSSDFCRVIHFLIVFFGCDDHPLLLNTLIHTYGCCASMEDARGTFDRVPKRNIVSWNALITGYALNGSCMESLECFREMEEGHIKPDGVTLISLFFACSHAGFVDKAVEFLGFMGKCGIALDKKHLGSLVDLLGRAGDFKSLENVLREMPLHPDAALWSTLLGACQMHNNLEVARQAFSTAVLEQPEETNPYVLMGNIYAKDGLHNG